jgi:hypothetical protein
MRRFTALMVLGLSMTLIGVIGMAIGSTASERVHLQSKQTDAALPALD